MRLRFVSITSSIVCLAIKQLLEVAKGVCIYLVYKIEVSAKMILSCYFHNSTKFLVFSLGGD